MFSYLLANLINAIWISYEKLIKEYTPKARCQLYKALFIKNTFKETKSRNIPGKRSKRKRRKMFRLKRISFIFLNLCFLFILKD